PAGSSTLDLDIVLGSTQTDLSFTVLQISTTFNASGDATTTAGISPGDVPTITGTCPSAVNIAETTLTLSYTTTLASSVLWTSGSNGSFGDATSASTNYTINDIDRANGYVDLSLQALSVDGCDNSISCLVNITGASFDYGDAPITYDLDENMIPVAGAATLSSDVFIGSVAPDTEGTNQPSALADGDGVEDDGVAILTYPPLSAGEVYTIDVTATNNSGEDAYLYVFMDLNTDGDFLGDEGEKSAEVIVPANSGLDTYQVSFTIPAGGSLTEDSTYVRLRIGTDEFGSSTSYGSTSNGEVEDYQFKLCDPPTLSLNASSGSTCVDAAITVSSNTFGGSATEVTITEDGAGSVDQSSISTSPFSFTYTPAAGDAGNTVTITVTTDNPDGDCVAAVETYALTVDVCDADLSLAKTVSPSSVEIGSDVVYTIVVSNAGPYEATNVVVSDILPSSFTYVSDDGGASHNNGVITWSAGT
ncbi:MAG: DUF11 domain-containing protein, partial [Gammaproteobacteria bacterium]|nr:DUF11 domain-containing protein [Gammaproteobacteria bacterium]